MEKIEKTLALLNQQAGVEKIISEFPKLADRIQTAILKEHFQSASEFFAELIPNSPKASALILGIVVTNAFQKKRWVPVAFTHNPGPIPEYLKELQELGLVKVLENQMTVANQEGVKQVSLVIPTKKLAERVLLCFKTQN